MGLPIAPILIGAGVGALGSTLMGGNPLKGAALGGLGGGLGGATGLFGGATGGAGMGGATATSAALPSVGIKLAPAIADGSLALSPTALGAGDMFAANSLAPSLAGGGISDLGAYATGSGLDIMAKNPTLWEQLKPYANIQNLSGAANIANQFQPKPFTVQSSGGGISKGSMPQGNDVSSLIASLKLPERKRISLL